MVVKQQFLTLFAATLLSFTTTSQAEMPTKGEILAQGCFSCHGYNGKPSGGAIMPLAFFPAVHIETQMLNFKNGLRPGTVMVRHAKGFTDEEIKIMAEYLGTN